MGRDGGGQRGESVFLGAVHDGHSVVLAGIGRLFRSYHTGCFLTFFLSFFSFLAFLLFLSFFDLCLSMARVTVHRCFFSCSITVVYFFPLGSRLRVL